MTVVDAGARRSVCGRDVIGQDFQFRNRIGPRALAQKQVSEDLPGIGSVSANVDDQASCSNAAAASAACDVGDQRRGGVAHMVVDFDVMIVMAAALAVDGQPDSNGAACRIKVVTEVRFTAESSDGEGACFERGVASDPPVVASHHARLEVEFIGDDDAEVATVGHVTGEVDATPARIS